ncbi:hypothetical protein GYMLUDRAFT_34366 [Collybiopsis luxurians FD-317 M1]|nr:hypothetical protein GYMLUDRAFT_34366 [Collybiopsis luxurians FD-317 M1]
MALQDARVRLHEDQVILRTPAPKLPVGKLGTPDALGWRWFQCTKTLQVLLPPDVGIRYEVFLRMEMSLLRLPSSHSAIQRYNKARDNFVTQCLDAKPNYPVRGISPCKYRYALEPGFKCNSIDEIVAEDDRLADVLSMSTFDARLVGRSALGLLGPKDEWGRSWIRLSENSQFLLPADTTFQYTEFIQCSILSNDLVNPDWEATLANFTKTCKDRSRYLGIYNGDRLYVLERDMSAPVLASFAGIIKAHYQGLADGAWTYAQYALPNLMTKACATKHLSSRTTRIRPTKQTRYAIFQQILGSLVEEQDDVHRESDADDSECDSESSLALSLTTTVVGSSSSLKRSRKDGRSSLLGFRRKTKLLSYGIPSRRMFERLRVLGGFNVKLIP